MKVGLMASSYRTLVAQNFIYKISTKYFMGCGEEL